MKFCFIKILVIIILLNKNCFCQVDTFYINIQIFDSAFMNPSNTVDGYSIEGVTVDEATYNSFSRKKDSIWSILNKAQGNYCKFYNDKNNIIEEGIWEIEFWIGKYKKYYSNGVLSIEGSYSTEEETLGDKIGVWRYYSEQGKLNFEEVYENGKMVNYIRHY